MKVEIYCVTNGRWMYVETVEIEPTHSWNLMQLRAQSARQRTDFKFTGRCAEYIVTEPADWTWDD